MKQIFLNTFLYLFIQLNISRKRIYINNKIVNILQEFPTYERVECEKCLDMLHPKSM